MPRQARKKSESGIYHIMIRGINRQIIFEDEEDSKVFLETMWLYKEEIKCKIYGYCLMKNHIHFIMGIDNEKLETFMRKFGAKYVYWYNWKYNRVGSLFQDRFKSEPIEDDKYFLTVLRYIHQNPVKAGLCTRVDRYTESSYNEYIGPKEKQLTDIDYALGILPIEEFERYNNEKNYDKCLEAEDIYRINDNEAKKLIVKLSKCNTASEFQALSIKRRDKFIRKLKEKGLSVRQIERLTGINRGVVQKI